MAREVSIKAKLAKEYITKFPNASKKTIGEKLFQDHPLTFDDAEDARKFVRHYTGANGRGRNTKILEHKTNFTRENPYGLPPTEAVPFEPYILPRANNNILFLSDIHLPYHDTQAVTLALDFGKKMEVNTIFLNGDIMDCYQASDHEKNPKNRDMSYEFQVCRDFLDTLEKNFPKAKIVYKQGNHEKRWERFLRVKAPILLDTDEFRLEVLLKLGQRGVTWIPNKQLVKIGKLNAIHGNEYKGGGGINVARTLWLRAGDNVIAGDKHKTQGGLKTNIDKKVVGTWSVGCLCELNPDYMPFNEWNLGFAHVTVEKNGEFSVHNKQIINGRVM